MRERQRQRQNEKETETERARDRHRDRGRGAFRETSDLFYFFKEEKKDPNRPAVKDDELTLNVLRCQLT